MVLELYTYFNYTERNNFDDITNELNVLKRTEPSNIITQLIQACVQMNPNDRPSMNAIVSFLKNECDYFYYERDLSRGSQARPCVN
uniref:Uncharacterized protein n=1 Tax=Meloidogyne enterolobii TaxID=390850 RepID=A0A6V7U8D5_MELEN|nr:unnamed protein product [Meloidogyne enterolobii]